MSTAVRLQRESDYWDAAHTGDVRTPARRFYVIGASRERRYRDWVMDAGAGPGRRALELGACLAGAGLDLARSGTDVTAIDISPATVEQARANAAALGLEDRMDLRVMDAEDLDLPDETFDVVCASAVIHHLDLDARDPRDRPRAAPGRAGRVRRAARAQPADQPLPAPHARDADARRAPAHDGRPATCSAGTSGRSRRSGSTSPRSPPCRSPARPPSGRRSRASTASTGRSSGCPRCGGPRGTSCCGWRIPARTPHPRDPAGAP